MTDPTARILQLEADHDELATDVDRLNSDILQLVITLRDLQRAFEAHTTSP